MEIEMECPECHSMKANWDIFCISEREKEPIEIDGAEVGFSMSFNLRPKSYNIYWCEDCGFRWKVAKPN